VSEEEEDFGNTQWTLTYILVRCSLMPYWSAAFHVIQ